MHNRASGTLLSRFFILRMPQNKVPVMFRYIPLELLEVVPQQLHWRAPAYVARNDLECLLASDAAADWVFLCSSPIIATPCCCAEAHPGKHAELSLH